MANPTATFETTKGEFKVELFQDQLPITTSNFKDLATSGFYDGLTFHRVIKGFMCQFGCPNSANPQSPIAGTGGPPGNTQYTLPDGSVIQRAAGATSPRARRQIERGRHHLHGQHGRAELGGSRVLPNRRLAVTRLTPSTSACPSQPVFGKVVDGMDAVTAIAAPDDGGTS